MWRDLRVLLTALLIVGVATISAPVLLIGGYLAYRVGADYLTRTHFDAAAWKAARGAHALPIAPVRIRMVNDLLDRHDLEGMTRSEVTARLGEPDDPTLGGGETLYPGWDMSYYLGP